MIAYMLWSQQDCWERRGSVWMRCCGLRTCSLPSCCALTFAGTVFPRKKSGLFLGAEPTKAVNPSVAPCCPQFYLQVGFSGPSLLSRYQFMLCSLSTCSVSAASSPSLWPLREPGDVRAPHAPNCWICTDYGDQNTIFGEKLQRGMGGWEGGCQWFWKLVFHFLLHLSCTQSLWYPLQLLKKASEYRNAAEISGAQCQILFSLLLSSTPDAFPCIEVLNF